MSESDTVTRPNDLANEYADQVTRTSSFLNKNLILGSAAVLVLNLVGFVVVSVYFRSRGVPLEEIGFGARTIWVALVIFFLPMMLLIFGFSAVLNGKSLAIICPKSLRFIANRFKRRPKDEDAPKNMTIGELLREDPLDYLYVFGLTALPLLLIQLALAVPHLFFGSISYNVTSSALRFQIAYIVASCVIGLVYFGLSKVRPRKKKEGEDTQPNARTSPDPRTLAVMNRIQKIGFALISLMAFMNWCLIFYLNLYPKMRPEFGGGMPQVVTMYFANGRLDQMNLGDPPPSMPDAKSARKVRIIYETDEDYRISPLIDQDPPVIYKVNKQDVTLVAISPPEQTP